MVFFDDFKKSHNTSVPVSLKISQVETIVKKFKDKTNKNSSQRCADVYDAGYINSILKEMTTTTQERMR